MAYTSFLTLALKRSWRRWGLTLLALLGTALTVGIIASIPIFADSVGFHILSKELAENAYGNANPAIAMRYYRIPSAPEVMTVQEALDFSAWLGHFTTKEVGLPVARRYTQIGSHALMLRARPDDPRYEKKNRDLRQVRIDAVVDMADQIEIIEGRPFAEAETADELLVWARPQFLDQLGVQVGEQYELFNYNANHPDVPLRVRIAGAWQAKDPAGAFWYINPHDLLAEEFITSLGAFARFIAPYMPQQTDFNFWYLVLDEGKMRFDQVDRYTKGVELAKSKAEGSLPSIRVDRSPADPLQDVQRRTRILEQLLFGFSLPVIAILFFFVATMAGITVRYQQNEVAILMSRGAGRLQILGISLLEGLIVIALGAPLGIMASLGVARAMSLNSGFLAFDRGEPLALATQALDWRLVALALAVSLLARLIPSLVASGQTIVSRGRERARARPLNIALHLMFTGMLIAATWYAYHQLHSRGTFGLISWQPGGGARRDPLLFLAPTLFVLTVAWVASQLFPLLMRLPDLIGRLLPSMSLYLGFRNLSRESAPYRVPLLLLIVCLCLGTFEASIARSADRWLVDRWQYRAGADYSFRLTVGDGGSDGVTGIDAWLMPVETWKQIPGVVDATRVGDYSAVPTINNIPKLRLLGIDRLDFARVAYFREDYARDPLGDLLNRLGANYDGLLVREEFLEENSLSIGDPLEMDVLVESATQRMPFRIVGTFQHWPTMYPNIEKVMVANLDYIFDQVGGIYPHSIWLRTSPDYDPDELWLGIRKLRAVSTAEVDSRALITEDALKLERVGIFGNLTIGFIAGSLMACLGLLLYTSASMIDRVRRFTILRAIGLRLSQVLATVSIEYLGVILYGIIIGAAAGIVTSRLFVPYFQFTEDPSSQIPPFVPHIAWIEIGWIVAAYILVLSVAELLVLGRAMRREVFQALRLGDEE